MRLALLPALAAILFTSAAAAQAVVPSGSLPARGTPASTDTYITVPIGGTAKQGALPDLASYVRISVKSYGAKCDGTTDDTSAINSALTAAAAVGGEVLVDGGCKVGTSGAGVTIPPGATLGGASWQGANPAVGSQLICNNQAAYVCLTVSGYSGSNGLLANGVHDLSIIGTGGTPVSGFIGLEYLAGYEVWGREIKVANADTCILWKAGVPTSGGISFDGSRINAAQCKSHYLVFDGWPEARFNSVRLGDNGSGDYAATDAVLFKNTACTTSGCGPNGIVFTALQINPQNSLGCAFRWSSYGGGSGVGAEFKIAHSHVEWHTSGGTAVFCSDSTWTTLSNLVVDSTTFSLGSASVPLFAFNSATALVQDYFRGNNFGGCTGITLAPSPASGAAFSDVWFTDNFGCVAASFTSNGTGTNKLYSLHNNWNALTVAGAWDGALKSDDYFSTITDSATGNVYMTEPQQTWTPKLALCAAATFGCGTSAGTQTVWGRYQRTPSGGFMASFQVTMTGTVGGSGFAEIEGLPFTCASSQQSAASGGPATYQGGMVNMYGPLIFQMSTVSGAPLMLFEPGAASGSQTNLVQIPYANLSSTSTMAGTVSCAKAS
ncbi:MAG TPA: hypothetical protein VG248_03375 [Caulobacteraceae bacterium]|jgi:hypothetical protein|nr:hypothetical protein [Caulobacteraceae bacterium]